ncbi:4-(cytidine 5'-diphospho)-2-C-methyl-D-erythritol kinase [Jannaschia sp. CCS1]|uniref:4-diphosphocytidyl-2-C-methyl-D-erythritol kinase n=1 Tax=Jannaschia sp. (strain CCS1) TaxID=290400 RepID=ISPE_JANSC|nr:4-(cytidine 5'-diphospho)-2-C-methyl-D-erythritol kinase [Jannaschia sp. CCS1]Q28V59.1 RecName: Full=4-diphosphocytidyl-2-C-methyl-D-erythritol kinase; Short=CMK; AltName: Full=4-(cytidine-5'-diphospho)-2-C-methyl-D-erythritol kinase [Jannaschia sp. CCS1]ABD53403.1 4-diphosphocytidyl-2-C-methyl-D-erythritol kinase [Jannaschia sp. CCS1]
MSAATFRGYAPAKVNLALHVTGRRVDGYHELDSLVVFAGVGDRLEIAPADALSLTVTGPRAEGVPDDARNLVWKAADWLAPGRGAAMTLDKHLPHAGGIGGGSADAACALRGLAEIWDVDVPDGAEALGADVPVCLHGQPVRMRGIGDVLDAVPPLPPMWIVLVNAGVEVPTGAVFKAMERVDNPPLPAPAWDGFDSFLVWLERTRNDMESSARSQAPVIGMVLERLRALPGCRFTRMSGSGGTCFGLFETEIAARDAALGLPKHWWVTYAPVLRA